MFQKIKARLSRSKTQIPARKDRRQNRRKRRFGVEYLEGRWLFAIDIDIWIQSYDMSDELIAEGESAEVLDSSHANPGLFAIDVQERYLLVADGDTLHIRFPMEDVIDANRLSDEFRFVLHYRPEDFAISTQSPHSLTVDPNNNNPIPVLSLNSVTNGLTRLQVESYVDRRGELSAPHSLTLDRATIDGSSLGSSDLVTSTITVRRSSDTTFLVDWQTQGSPYPRVSNNGNPTYWNDTNVTSSNGANNAIRFDTPIATVELPRLVSESSMVDTTEADDEAVELTSKESEPSTIDITLGMKGASGDREPIAITRREPESRVEFSFEGMSSRQANGTDSQGVSDGESEHKHWDVHVEPSHAVAVDLILSQYATSHQTLVDRLETRSDSARKQGVTTVAPLREDSASPGRPVSRNNLTRTATRQLSDLPKSQASDSDSTGELVRELWDIWVEVARLTSDSPVATTALVSMASHMVLFQGISETAGKPAWELVTSSGKSTLLH